MSNITFWSLICALYAMTAAAPWGEPSFLHSWIDAFYYGIAVFSGLKAITAAKGGA